MQGPWGGVKLAEFMAKKMRLQPQKRLLDAGTNRGYQTCFLAKEYGVFAIGIDPWLDRDAQQTHSEILMENAHAWGVSALVLGCPGGCA